MRLVVGWPEGSDAGGVFYAATLLGVTAVTTDGAAALAAAVAPGGDERLVSAVGRALGRAARGGAPAGVSIALLKLLVGWLQRYPAVVAMFLSSAAALPLVVELVTGGDGNVHTRGLAAALLGVCVAHPSDGEGVSAAPAELLADGGGGGFLGGRFGGGRSGKGGSGGSAVVSCSSLVDVVRHRVGVADFSARLEDLRASDAYASALATSRDEPGGGGGEEDGAGAGTGPLAGRSPAFLLTVERIMSGLCRGGGVGHELWYDTRFVEVFGEVYAAVQPVVVQLVSAPKAAPPRQGNRSGIGAGLSNGFPDEHVLDGRRGNGGMRGGGHGGSGGSDSVDGDGDRDKDATVLLSYKELIRQQDEAVAAARAENSRLMAALAEAEASLSASATAASGERGVELAAAAERAAIAEERADALELLLAE